MRKGQVHFPAAHPQTRRAKCSLCSCFEASYPDVAPVCARMRARSTGATAVLAAQPAIPPIMNRLAIVADTDTVYNANQTQRACNQLGLTARSGHACVPSNTGNTVAYAHRPP